MIRILHVTRLPPSPSGVSLYAQEVEAAYRLLGDVAVHLLPADPKASQSFPLALKTWLRLRRLVPRGSRTIVSFELAGRGLAETWAAWALARGGRRVWLTIHDVPSVCGAAFLSRGFDRRGARRLGLALSRSAGHRMERDLLRRAELVTTLCRSGAQAVSEKYGLDRPVMDIPHVLAGHPTTSTEPRILVPGYVSGIESILPLISDVAALPEPWRLVIGAASDSVSAEVALLARQIEVAHRIELLGFVDEATLDREFSRAAVVVRWRREGWLSGQADHAVSGPLIRALGRDCAVVTNDRRGATQCLHEAQVAVVGDGEKGAQEMAEAVRRFVHDDDYRMASAAAGLAHIEQRHSPEAVASRLAELAP